MKKFIILTTQRSGSTFFWRYIDQHPNISAHGEMFLKELDNSKSYASYVRKSFTRNISNLIYKKKIINDYLESFYKADDGIYAICFKIMYNQISKPLEAWFHNENIHVIHLIRENILKVLVSAESARLRNLYHAKNNTEVKKVKVILNTKNLLNELHTRYELIQCFRDRFETHPYCEVFYETLTANIEKETGRVFHFLGVPPVTGLKPDLKKINPESLDEIIENYTEVKNVLLGTQFEHFLF